MVTNRYPWALRALTSLTRVSLVTSTGDKTSITILYYALAGQGVLMGKFGFLKFCQFGQTFNNTVYYGLGPGRTAGDVYINGDDLVHPANNVVCLFEYTAGGATGPHGNDNFGRGHLVVNLAKHFFVSMVHRPGDDEDIGVLRVSDIQNPEPFDIVEGVKQARVSMSHPLHDPQS